MKTKAPGISLIEVVIASVLILASLSGAVTMVGTSTIQIAENQNRLAATFLAQECLELSRNARDSASKQTIWHCPFFDIEDANLPPATEDALMKPDWSTKRTIAVSEIQEKIDCYDSKTGRDSDSFGVKIMPENDAIGTIELNGTTFKRTLEIRDIEALGVPFISGNNSAYWQAQKMTIECAVGWQGRSGEQTVRAAEVLTRWQK